MLILGLSLYTSALTILMMYLLGSKRRSGFLVSLVNQVNWAVLNIMTGAYGLLVLTVVMTYLAIRGYRNWKES